MEEVKMMLDETHASVPRRPPTPSLEAGMITSSAISGTEKDEELCTSSKNETAGQTADLEGHTKAREARQSGHDGTKEVDLPDNLESHDNIVDISLPTISRITTQIQAIQSKMGKFWDISLISLAQGLASIATLLYIKDDFSRTTYMPLSLYWQNALCDQDYQDCMMTFVDGTRVLHLVEGSVLCSIYATMDSIILAVTKPRASIFEVIVPLVFGSITLFGALTTFLWWRWNNPGVDRKVMDNPEWQNFLPATIFFLCSWFVYLRVWPLVRKLRR